MIEFRRPYRFPDLTEMENSTPPMWIQWISIEANELCNKLTLIIEQRMNEMLSEFRLIPEDVEQEGEAQPDLIGFETLQPATGIESRGEEGNSLQQGLQEPQAQPHSENLNITQINAHQTTGTAVNEVPRTEKSTQPHRPQ